MWILRSANGGAERILRLASGTPKTIGRGPLADFVVDAALMSRVHCRLLATDAALTIEDLNSTNGTFVNGRRVSRAQLTEGDHLRLGRLKLDVARG